MNDLLAALYSRKSVRAYEDRAIPADAVESILRAAIEAPSAGNQQQYTILDIEDQELKERLAVLCDNQPFIAKAKLVLVFLADCRKWLRAYEFAKVEHRRPGPGDFLLACEDALIAAQSSVIAAESLGIGSCYIGDVLENREAMGELLGLKDYVVPICMLVFGYPTRQQLERIKPRRFAPKYTILKNAYRELSEEETRTMLDERNAGADPGFEAFVDAFCKRKYMSAFAAELNRSSQDYLREFWEE
jgi:nitroreductase